jgi:hypothetical protein
MKAKRTLLAVTFICIWLSTLASIAWAKKPPKDKILVEISLEWVNSVCTNATSAHPNCQTTLRATLTTKDNKAPVSGKAITFYQDLIKQPGTAKTDGDGHAVKVLKTLQGPHTAFAVFNNSDKTYYAELPNSNSISYSCYIESSLEFDLPDSLEEGTRGEVYGPVNVSPFASGGSPPYHFGFDTMGIGLPMGLNLSIDGVISGTPTSPKGTYHFTICAIDRVGDEACQNSSIEIEEDEEPITMTWVVSDQCNNGSSIDYKFYDFAHHLVWPSSSTHYSERYGDTYRSSLSCVDGSKVCIGANSGSSYWGVGLNGTHSCSDCCYYCDGGTHSYTFGCTPNPPPDGCASGYFYCWEGGCCRSGSSCCGPYHVCCPSGFPIYCPNTNKCYSGAGSSPCGIMGEYVCATPVN